MINLCNSLAINCLQNNLNDLALIYLLKAYKTDISLHEIDKDFKPSILSWKGRLLMFNLLAYHFSVIQKDSANALDFMSEALDICRDLKRRII